jgi:hypothetical protein
MMDCRFLAGNESRDAISRSFASPISRHLKLARPIPSAFSLTTLRCVFRPYLPECYRPENRHQDDSIGHFTSRATAPLSRLRMKSSNRTEGRGQIKGDPRRKLTMIKQRDGIDASHEKVKPCRAFNDINAHNVYQICLLHHLLFFTLLHPRDHLPDTAPRRHSR